MLLLHGGAAAARRVGAVGDRKATEVEKHERTLQLFLQTCMASVKVTTAEVFFLKMTTAEVFLLCLQSVPAAPHLAVQSDGSIWGKS